MKKLLIVESPAKIKTIRKFLGNDFKVMSTVGHIKDLPPKKLGITINGSIKLDYVTIEGKENVIADICKQASTSDEIYLATDPDREGEIIAWHIGQEIAKVINKKTPMHRITFNEITKSAVEQAAQHPGVIDDNKVDAQQARRILDRWVGYEVSPILWKKVAQGTSAGRVQSVALRMVCEREEAIRNFKPEEYWSITGTFEHHKATIEAALTHIGKKKAEIKNEKTANKVVDEIKKAHFVIDSITDKKRLKNPPAPFMTSSLQQAAFNRLGFSTKKTMQIAQKLYEGISLDDASSQQALITYMRTDSLRLSDTAIKASRDYIKKNFDKEYLPTRANLYVKGKAQDAHEAIRPIDPTITPSFVAKYASPDLAKLYRLIWERFIACQMKPAEYAQRQVVIIGDKYSFKVTGSTLLFDGFLRVYGEEKTDKEEKVVLPKTLKEKDSVDLQEILPKQHFTQPPPRFNESSLVKEMVKEGIGRPSTYVAILNTIQTRSYITYSDKKRFVPTELGMAVNKILVENLPDIMDLSFTAHMEEDLDKIAEGKLERDKLLRDFYKVFKKDLENFAGSDAKRKTQETDIVCPECKKHKLLIRFGKSGEFLGCAGYPECNFTSNFKRDENGNIQLVEAEKPELLEEKCPNCGKPLRRLVGKYGPFFACSGYPECKYIKQEKADVPCPECGGDLVKRRWKGGSFWGCSNYPKCKFAVFGEIEEKPCPKCHYPLVGKKTDKNGNVSIFCIKKECGYKA